MHSQEKSVQPQKHCSILQRMRQHPLKGRYITMKVTITGKNIEVSEYLRDLALKKIAKLERFGGCDSRRFSSRTRARKWKSRLD